MPLWNLISDKGGYTVHPVPTPESKIEDNNSKIKEGNNNQKDKLFKRGNAISAVPNIKGISQLPNPPMEIGITIKKIIIKAWAVIITLYKWLSSKKDPTIPNSKRIKNLKLKPTKPVHMLKRKYKFPMSLWLVLKNQRNQVIIL